MSATSSVIALILAVTFVAAARVDAAESTAAAAAKSAAASSAATPAAVRSKKLTAQQREFAAAYVSAANSKDIEALRKLVAPEVLACHAKETKPFIDRWLRRQGRFAISADYHASFAPYRGGLQTSPLLSYPANPTETMTLDFGTQGQSVVMTRHLTQEKGKLYLVAPCLTPAGVQRFQAQQKQRDERIQQARAIYGKLEDPLRTQLRTLIKQNKVRDAMQLCTSKLKVNNLVARDVLLLLDDREPD
jgi:hypothetical protein